MWTKIKLVLAGLAGIALIWLRGSYYKGRAAAAQKKLDTARARVKKLGRIKRAQEKNAEVMERNAEQIVEVANETDHKRLAAIGNRVLFAGGGGKRRGSHTPKARATRGRVRVNANPVKHRGR